tara:strand:+ start:70 stop:483 length:414 start_codon:yes stop_codon:yes gene_type:complete
MKLTRRQLKQIISESLEETHPTSIEGLMRSRDLQAINTGIDLAAILGEIPEPEGQRYREAKVQKDGRTVHRAKVLLKFDSIEDADIFEVWLKTYIKFKDELTNNDIGEAFYYRNPFGHSSRARIVIADEYDVPDPLL